MYSSGLPILYISGFLFYFVLFWLYKYLLLNYYQKTRRFNEKLPRESVRYIKVGIFFHCLMALLMFSNSRILSSFD
jgi:uncharacterized protein YacL